MSSSMPITIKSVLLISILLVCPVAVVAQTVAEDELQAAERKWAANRPQNYEFVFEQICVCPPAPPDSPAADPIMFRVANGMGTVVGSWTAASPQIRYGLGKYSTVEQLFAFIRTELQKQHYRIDIQYDPDAGYPRRVYVDP